MLHTKQQRSLGSTRPGYRPKNLGLILGLLFMLMLAPPTALAAPTSALLKSIMPDSSSMSGQGSSGIDPVALTEEIKKKLAATSAELAHVPSEDIAGSSDTGLPGDVDIFRRRLHLRQLVFLYQGQIARLSSLQARQQRRLELESQVANWSGFSEPSLHPFLRADELKESIASLSRRVDELESWIPAINLTGLQVVTVAESSTVKLRQADEAVEQEESPDQQVRLSRDRDQLAIQNQIDLARAMGFQIEKQAVQEELLETRAMLQLANKQLSMASENVELTNQDLIQIQKNIDTESQQIIAELKRVVSAPVPENNAIQQKNLASGNAGKTAQLQSREPEQSSRLSQVQLITTDIKLQALNRILAYL